MTATDLFHQLTHALDQSEIPYMLTGSFASNVYGMGRATMDVDIVVSATAQQLRTLSRYLTLPEYECDLEAALEALKHQSMFNVFDTIRGWKIDSFFKNPPSFTARLFAIDNKPTQKGSRLSIITAVDLVIAKLEWAKAGASLRQIEDVTGILKVRGPSLDGPYIEKWVGALNLRDQWDEARKQAGFD